MHPRCTGGAAKRESSMSAVSKRFSFTAIAGAVALLGSVAGAQAGHIEMYASKGFGSGIDGGEIVILNQSDVSQSFLVGNAGGGAGITGLDFDGQGNLWASTLGDIGSYSNLIQIDRSNGAVLGTVGAIHTNANDVAGSAISIGDLAFDRTTNRLYGIESLDHDGVNGGNIYTIDLGTGLATLMGATIWGATGGLAFDSAGTLYALGYDPNVGPFGTNMLFTLDSNDASEITRVTVSQNDFIFSGLGINPLTGQIYATEDDYFGTGTGTGNIYLVDPNSGLMTFLGKPSGVVSDVAFRVPEPSMLALLSLAVVGLGVARRRRAG
jgi:hypothetical protein